MRFEERQWMPWWVSAIFVLGPVVICVPLVLTRSIPAWGLVVPAGGGAFWALIFWLSTARRWIRVDGRSLRIGDRRPIPFGEITEARVVEGPELKRLRQAMIQGRGLPVGAAALPAIPVAGGALGSLVLGYSLVRGRRSRSGNGWGILAQPWMPRALLVGVPDDRRAPVLLIGTRRPEELLAAIRGGSSTPPHPSG